MSLAALVLAAGRGERLRPFTDTVPKPLLEVGGRTLLEAALDRVATVVPLSPETVAVNAHWIAEAIGAAVEGRAHLSVEQPEALGTAGAVGRLRPWIGGRDLLIANGDVWWDRPIDLAGFVEGWDRRRPRLVVVEDNDRPDFGGRWRFAGLSLLANTDVRRLQPVPSGLYEQVWRDADLDLVPIDVVFIDCGTPEDLARARACASMS